MLQIATPVLACLYTTHTPGRMPQGTCSIHVAIAVTVLIDQPRLVLPDGVTDGRSDLQTALVTIKAAAQYDGEKPATGTGQAENKNQKFYTQKHQLDQPRRDQYRDSLTHSVH